MEIEKVTLVDPADKEIGSCEKLDAHRRGLLHRAFSVFLSDDGGNLFLQQRAAEKYHCPGLWSNSCCGHPRPGEPILAAAERRVFEELNVRCKLSLAGAFTYRAVLHNRLIEHEFDHVLLGNWSEDLVPNPHEVMAWRVVSPDDIMRELSEHPESFTPWFQQAFEVVRSRAGSNDGVMTL